MKQKIVIGFFFLLLSISVFAKSPAETLGLVEIVNLPTTDVKDQHRSSTCWSFAGISFIESEMMRKGIEVVDISEMFIVRKCYEQKLDKYIRMHGFMNFTPGGTLYDVFWVLKNYGLMPESVYGTKGQLPVHSELDMQMKELAKSAVKKKTGHKEYNWIEEGQLILDNQIGALPDNFRFEGLSYSPETFATKRVQINAEDYLFFSSFTHHPFNQNFCVEIPDNWLWAEVYNVKLLDLRDIIRNALTNGYTIGLAMDITEREFKFSDGYAQLGEEISKKGIEELQKERQTMFDDYRTTDDHGMHITGYALDKHGNYFYKVKNSWDSSNVLGGYIYVSETYLLLKSIYILVHKGAVTEHVKKSISN